MPIVHLAASAGADVVLHHLKEDGAVVIDTLLEQQTIDALLWEIGAHLQSDGRSNGEVEASSGLVRRLSSLVRRSERFRSVAIHPTIIGVMDRFFAHVTNYQLGGAQFTELLPGAPAQGVHQDQWAYDFFDFPQDYEVQCNLMWALTDYSTENGGTRIIPGSHRFPNFRSFDVAETEAVEMRAGSVLVYSGRLYHGGGENRAQAPRRGISVNYTAGWLRAQENPHLGLPMEIARTLPIELLWLMGYSRGAFFVNYFDTDREPIEALFPDATARGIPVAPPGLSEKMKRRWEQFFGQ